MSTNEPNRVSGIVRYEARETEGQCFGTWEEANRWAIAKAEEEGVVNVWLVGKTSEHVTLASTYYPRGSY